MIQDNDVVYVDFDEIFDTGPFISHSEHPVIDLEQVTVTSQQIPETSSKKDVDTPRSR